MKRGEVFIIGYRLTCARCETDEDYVDLEVRGTAVSQAVEDGWRFLTQVGWLCPPHAHAETLLELTFDEDDEGVQEGGPGSAEE